MPFTKDHMSGLERLEALLQGRGVDRVPIGSLSDAFNARNAGYPIGDAFDDPEKSFHALQWTAEQYAWDPIPHLPTAHSILGAADFGGRMRSPQGEYEGAMVIESYPVQSEDDVAGLAMPDPKSAGRIPLSRRVAQLQEKHGLPVFFFSRSPFTLAANLCGVGRFLRWTLKRPDLCEALLRMALDHIFNVLEDWTATYGADRLFAWMSSPSESNQLISPRIFKKFALPYHMAYQSRLSALGIERFGLHICGDQNLNLPVLAEAMPWKHPSILSFGHEVALETAAAHFPDDIIYGNIEPAVIQTGSPEQVYTLCRDAILKGRKIKGGFILGPGCGLPAMAPPVNVFAMTKAVQDVGWYG